jgi:hypothetical protein
MAVIRVGTAGGRDRYQRIAVGLELRNLGKRRRPCLLERPLRAGDP